MKRLKALYAATTIGDPLDDEHLMGPLVDSSAIVTMLEAIETAKGQGARVVCGGERLDLPGGCYVPPCLGGPAGHLPTVPGEACAQGRYFQGSVLAEGERGPEGIEGRVPHRGGVPQGLHQLTRGVRGGWLGCRRVPRPAAEGSSPRPLCCCPQSTHANHGRRY